MSQAYRHNKPNEKTSCRNLAIKTNTANLKDLQMSANSSLDFQVVSGTKHANPICLQSIYATH